MTTSTSLDPIDRTREAARARAEHELKKVQQRTAAIIVFAISYHCVFALVALAKVLQNEGRDSDAYALAGMAVIVALLMTCGIRGILGHRILSAIWTPLAIAPPIIAAILVL